MAFINLAELKEKELIPGFHVRFVHSENMTFAYWAIDAGAALPKHSHPHEQVANVTEGEIELTVGEEMSFRSHNQSKFDTRRSHLTS